MRTRSVATAVAAGLVVLLAACGGDGGGASAKDDAKSSTTAKPFDKTADHLGDDSTCTADSGDPDALEALMPDDPAGYERQADDVGDTGPSNLAKAASDDGEDDAKDVLTQQRFTAGYQRLWVSEADDEQVAILYRFCDADGAKAYFDRTKGFDQGEGIDEFSPEGISGAYAIAGGQEGYSAAQILVQHDDYLLMATADGDSSAVGLDQLKANATDLAKAMEAKVGAE